MSDLRTAYQSLWNSLETTKPSEFQNQKEMLFYRERDLDRKIQLLMVAALIELVEKKDVDTGTRAG